MPVQAAEPTAPPEELALRIRLFVYQHFVERSRAPSPAEIASAFALTPERVGEILAWLEREADAIVLLPDSPYLWMAEPFSAVPTDYRVTAGERHWWGNCVWDAMAILALLGRDGRVDSLCPHSGEPLTVTIRDGELAASPHRVHFAVPARDWWQSVGFT